MIHSHWLKVQFLIDSCADVSIVSLRDSVVPDQNVFNIVKGIGGKQAIGPEKDYIIRFCCNPDKKYSVKLSETALDSVRDIVILGRDFLSQFDETEFDWNRRTMAVLC